MRKAKKAKLQVIKNRIQIGGKCCEMKRTALERFRLQNIYFL